MRGLPRYKRQKYTEEWSKMSRAKHHRYGDLETYAAVRGREEGAISQKEAENILVHQARQAPEVKQMISSAAEVVKTLGGVLVPAKGKETQSLLQRVSDIYKVAQVAEAGGAVVLKEAKPSAAPLSFATGESKKVGTISNWSNLPVTTQAKIRSQYAEAGKEVTTTGEVRERAPVAKITTAQQKLMTLAAPKVSTRVLEPTITPKPTVTVTKAPASLPKAVEDIFKKDAAAYFLPEEKRMSIGVGVAAPEKAVDARKMAEIQSAAKKIAMFNAAANAVKKVFGFARSPEQEKQLEVEREKLEQSIAKKFPAAAPLITKVGGVVFGTTDVKEVEQQIRKGEEKPTVDLSKIKMEMGPPTIDITKPGYVPIQETISAPGFERPTPTIAPEKMREIAMGVRERGIGVENTAKKVADFNKLVFEYNAKDLEGKATPEEKRFLELKQTELRKEVENLYPNAPQKDVFLNIGADKSLEYIPVPWAKSQKTDPGDIAEKLIVQKPEIEKLNTRAEALTNRGQEIERDYNEILDFAGIDPDRIQKLREVKSKEEVNDIIYTGMDEFANQNPDAIPALNQKIEKFQQKQSAYSKDVESYQKDATAYEARSKEDIMAEFKKIDEQKEAVRMLRRDEVKGQVDTYKDKMKEKYSQTIAIPWLWNKKDQENYYSLVDKIKTTDKPEIIQLRKDFDEAWAERNKLAEKYMETDKPILESMKHAREIKAADKKVRNIQIALQNAEIKQSDEEMKARAREIESPYLRYPARFGAGALSKLRESPEEVALTALTGFGAGAVLKTIGTGALRWAGQSALRQGVVKAAGAIGLVGLTGLAAKDSFEEIIQSPYKVEAAGELALDALAFGFGAGKGAKAAEFKVTDIGDIKVSYKPPKKIIETTGMPREMPALEVSKISPESALLVEAAPTAEAAAAAQARELRIRKMIMGGEMPEVAVRQRLADIVLDYDKQVTRFGKTYDVKVETRIKPDNSIFHTEKMGDTTIIIRQEAGSPTALKQTFYKGKLIGAGGETIKGFDLKNVLKTNELIKIEKDPIVASWKTKEGRGILQEWKGQKVDVVTEPVNKGWMIKGVLEQQAEQLKATKIGKAKVAEADFYTKYVRGPGVRKDIVGAVPGKQYLQDIKLALGERPKGLPKYETITGEPVWEAKPEMRFGPAGELLTTEAIMRRPTTMIEYPELETTIARKEAVTGVLRMERAPKVSWTTRLIEGLRTQIDNLKIRIAELRGKKLTPEQQNTLKKLEAQLSEAERQEALLKVTERKEVVAEKTVLKDLNKVIKDLEISRPESKTPLNKKIESLDRAIKTVEKQKGLSPEVVDAIGKLKIELEGLKMQEKTGKELIKKKIKKPKKEVEVPSRPGEAVTVMEVEEVKPVTKPVTERVVTVEKMRPMPPKFPTARGLGELVWKTVELPKQRILPWVVPSVAVAAQRGKAKAEMLAVAPVTELKKVPVVTTTPITKVTPKIETVPRQITETIGRPKTIMPPVIPIVPWVPPPPLPVQPMEPFKPIVPPGIGGAIPQGYRRWQQGRGMAGWTVVNPIADFGTAFFGRQRAKMMGFGGGPALKELEPQTEKVGSLGQSFSDIFGIGKGATPTMMRTAPTMVRGTPAVRRTTPGIDFAKKIKSMI